eukprot:TRINITY_DN3682_c0_g1_i2.p1 TRINITY_DN3682_c0_g1~~TRINITY_DN3682_c0_g1_i2.p1  ORF type:complete len:607 (+),score=106.36 TRINITY_DN3682_c0_g1_i2:27-1823(+)
MANVNSSAPNLMNAAINLTALREHARKELVAVLDSVQGAKGLVLDPKLSGPLGLVCEVSLLKEYGVEKIYLLGDRLETECKNLIYIIRPKLNFMKYVADHIHRHREEGSAKEYSLFFVPRRTMIVERHLEEEGVFEFVTIGEFRLDLIPFDQDLLSLEIEDSYKECFLEGDKTSLYYVARSIMKLQALFGIIPHLKGKGACAKSVMEMVLRMRREMGADEPSIIAPEIDTLILIDRQTDMITPMCTQLTYEGMIDEVFGIQNNCAELDAELLALTEEQQRKAKEAPGKKTKQPLNSNDKLYTQLRDANLSVLGPLLNKKAKEIDDYYKKRYEFQTVTQIRDFMKGLGGYQQDHQSLRLHTNIVERILNLTRKLSFRRHLETEQSLLTNSEEAYLYIEECMYKQDPILKVLRLMTLYSLTTGGIPPKIFESMRAEFLSVYGYEHLFTLTNMEKLGLIKRQEGKGWYQAVKKPLRLIVEDVNEAEPNDIAFVYSGYAPLSVRLIEMKDQWRQMDEVMRMLPGPTVEKDQDLPLPVREARGTAGARSKVTLVFFVGGITFTEIAALRYLNSIDETTDYIIATTKLLNGDGLISSLLSPFAQ